MPNKRTILRYIVPVILILTSILFFKLMLATKPEPIVQNAEERAWSVNSIIVKKSDHQPVIQLYGEVISKSDIQLTALVEASVLKLYIKPGDKVSEGQRLLILDNSRLKQIMLQRKAELDEINAIIDDEVHQLETDNVLLQHEISLLKIANNAVKRTKTLKKSQMASGSQIDDAKRSAIQQEIAIIRLKATIANHPSRLAQLKAKRKQALSRLNLAENDISHTIIKSPVNGIVTLVSTDDAEFVRKGSALLSINDTSQLEIQSLLPKKQYNSLNQTLAINANVKARILMPTNSISATLLRLPNNLASGLAGSYAFFKIDVKNPNLIIGQTVKILVELATQSQSIALPHDAIYGTDSVFLIKDNRLKRIKIKWLGETFVGSQKTILISSNAINEGDEILINKFANAAEGLKVKTHKKLVLNNGE